PGLTGQDITTPQLGVGGRCRRAEQQRQNGQFQFHGGTPYDNGSMIALLSGVLVEKHPNQAIVDVGGVGDDVTIPISTFSSLPDAGATVRLRIYTHVREDALALYGFLREDEKALFEKLISVSGIGPTLAVKVLSGLAAADLILAIRKGEVERLVR